MTCEMRTQWFWRRPGSVGRVFQSTAIKGWRVGSQPPFLFSPRGFGFGCRDCTRREDYDMDYDTVRDEAADGSAAKREASADGGKHDRSRAAVTGEDMPRRS